MRFATKKANKKTEIEKLKTVAERYHELWIEARKNYEECSKAVAELSASVDSILAVVATKFGVPVEGEDGTSYKITLPCEQVRTVLSDREVRCERIGGEEGEDGTVSEEEFVITAVPRKNPEDGEDDAIVDVDADDETYPDPDDQVSLFDGEEGEDDGK